MTKCEWQPAIVRHWSKIGCDFHHWKMDAATDSIATIAGVRIRVRQSVHVLAKDIRNGTDVPAGPHCPFWDIHPDDWERCLGSQIFAECQIHVD